MDELMHDLLAPYALDALDADDLREFEEHLSHCERCREELATLREPVTALAFGAPEAAPPPDLRERLLEQARSERPNVVPLSRRFVVAPALAAVATCAAVALGIWIAVGAGGSPGPLRSSALAGAAGSVITTATGGTASSCCRTSGAAPRGKTYEAWVIEGSQARPAGLFRAGAGTVTRAALGADPSRGAGRCHPRARRRGEQPDLGAARVERAALTRTASGDGRVRDRGSPAHRCARRSATPRRHSGRACRDTGRSCADAGLRAARRSGRSSSRRSRCRRRAGAGARSGSACGTPSGACEWASKAPRIASWPVYDSCGHARTASGVQQSSQTSRSP